MCLYFNAKLFQPSASQFLPLVSLPPSNLPAGPVHSTKTLAPRFLSALLTYTSMSVLSPLHLRTRHSKQSPHCSAPKPRSSVTSCPGLPGTCLPWFYPGKLHVPGNPSVSANWDGRSAYLESPRISFYSSYPPTTHLALPAHTPPSHVSCLLVQASTMSHPDHPKSLFMWPTCFFAYLTTFFMQLPEDLFVEKILS